MFSLGTSGYPLCLRSAPMWRATTAWMTSSHLVNATLLMAADNMRALGVLLFPNDRLSMPLYAHYPILRSILEASAQVKWLLEPEERTERVTRMLP